MHRWVEERCEAVRLALRIGGFPAEGDLPRLVDWLAGIVILRHRDGARARCRHCEDGRAAITLSARQPPRQYDRRLCHELGHALLTVGMGSLLRGAGAPEVLAAHADARDEALAAAFVRAWYLPSRLVVQWGQDVEGLAWSSNCDWEMVQERRRELRGQVVALAGLPRWCAAREYHLIVHMERSLPLVDIARRGMSIPQWSLTCTPVSVEETALQVSADLIALTAGEFALKYSPAAVGEGRPVEISLSRIRAWAAGGGG